MKVHKITTKNFLALRDCTIEGLDEHLNFFVGPNGSGKTSLFRALRVLKEAFEAAGSGTRKTLNHLYSIHADPQQIDIDVKVSWDTDHEQKAICAFLYASLSTTNTSLNEAIRRVQHLSTYQITPEMFDRFTDWLREQFTPGRLHFLFTGQLHLTYREETGTKLSYVFTCKGEPVTILMAAYPPQDGSFWRGSIPISSTTIWRAGNELLLEYLFSAKNSLKQNTKKTKSFRKVELMDEMAVEVPVDAQTLEKERLEAEAEKYFVYPRGVKPAPLDMEDFLLDFAEKHGYLEVGTVAELQTYQPEYVLLREMSGINFSQTNSARLSCSKFFALLLHNACVFTKSVFTPFEEPAPFQEKRVFSSSKVLLDEKDIPYWLLGIRDGNVDQKARYKRIQDTFKLLVGEEREFDLSVEPSMQFSSDGRQEEISKIDILVTDATGTISMTSQGSGLWEALVLAVFLDDSKGRVILLDEPAASLHPNMQHRLVELLQNDNTPGQVLIVTHSAHLLPTRADRLQHVYRFQKEAKGTRVFSGGSFLRTELQRVENKFASSINVANLLFTNGVLLVEGATEAGAFPVWIPLLEKGKRQTLADMNIALHDIGGKSNFPFYLRLLKEFGVLCTAIGDGDALLPYFLDKHGEKQKSKCFSALWQILQDLCPTITIPQETDPFEVFKREAARAGFYTYDTSSPITFEGIPEVQAYLQGLAQPKKKVDTVYEARFLAESIRTVPPLAKSVLKQAIGQLRPLPNRKGTKRK
ncbi:MAG TPA: AAA family ATPase [Ktedonobacteraceae bacterium]|nr:AAA family ATPase [Ktedonobacteraceae bacterium]